MKKHFSLILVLSVLFITNYGHSQINPSDGCAANALPVNGTCVNNSYTLSGSYSNGALIEGACSTAAAGNDRDDGWYSFTATTSSTTVTCTGSRNFVLAAWPNCGAANVVGDEIDCNTIAAGAAGGSITFPTTIGVTYYIQIHRRGGNNTANMTGNICIEEVPAASNNDPCTASALPVNSSCVNTTGTNVNATDSGIADPGCASYSTGDVWYAMVVPANGYLTVTTSENGGFTDGGLAIYTGACGSLTLLTCTDDSNGLFGTTTESGLTPGSTVYARVWDYADGFGTFDICAEEYTPPAAPSNDECSSPLPVTVNADDLCGSVTSGTVEGATASPYSTACAGSEDDDVWFSFTATTTAHNISLLNIAGSTTDLAFSVWRGTCPILGFESGSCTDPDDADIGNLTVGDTYLVRVYSYTAITGQTTTFDVCVGEGPAAEQDCAGGVTICDDAVMSGNSDGSGATDDLDASNEGCLFGENESSWYYFEAATGGDIELNITTLIDYDFAIWGPYTGIGACPPVGPPLRCSYDGTYGNTGLAAGSGDTEDGTGGTLDSWVDPINANTGDSYIMLIDNFTADGTSFTLDWTLSAGATLSCSLLPVTFSDFSITEINNGNLLSWSTYSELNNSHFLVQKMDDDGNYYTIQTILGQNNSTEVTPYVFKDDRPEFIVNYYRIIQVDFDGNETIYTPKSVDNSKDNVNIIARFNALGQKVDETFIGVVILMYNDGHTEKIYQNNK